MVSLTRGRILSAFRARQRSTTGWCSTPCARSWRSTPSNANRSIALSAWLSWQRALRASTPSAIALASRTPPKGGRRSKQGQPRQRQIRRRHGSFYAREPLRRPPRLDGRTESVRPRRRLREPVAVQQRVQARVRRAAETDPAALRLDDLAGHRTRDDRDVATGQHLCGHPPGELSIPIFFIVSFTKPGDAALMLTPRGMSSPTARTKPSSPAAIGVTAALPGTRCCASAPVVTGPTRRRARACDMPGRTGAARPSRRRAR